MVANLQLHWQSLFLMILVNCFSKLKLGPIHLHERKASNNGFYYGFDLIFDEAEFSGPSRCLGNEVIDNVERSAVKIVFEHQGFITDPIH